MANGRFDGRGAVGAQDAERENDLAFVIAKAAVGERGSPVVLEQRADIVDVGCIGAQDFQRAGRQVDEVGKLRLIDRLKARF